MKFSVGDVLVYIPWPDGLEYCTYPFNRLIVVAADYILEIYDVMALDGSIHIGWSSNFMHSRYDIL